MFFIVVSPLLFSLFRIIHIITKSHPPDKRYRRIYTSIIYQIFPQISVINSQKPLDSQKYMESRGFQPFSPGSTGKKKRQAFACLVWCARGESKVWNLLRNCQGFLGVSGLVVGVRRPFAVSSTTNDHTNACF